VILGFIVGAVEWHASSQAAAGRAVIGYVIQREARTRVCQMRLNLLLILDVMLGLLLSFTFSPFVAFFSTIFSTEKWDQSGANDAMARMSANIPQGTKEYISLTSSQLFNREHLRSMTVYFGIGEEKPFYLEKSPALLLARLKHNISFFYLNYFMVTALLFCLTLLISPSAIIGIGVLALAWTWVIRASSTGSLKIGGKQNKIELVPRSVSYHVYFVLTH
jgi:hypothetical protein